LQSLANVTANADRSLAKVGFTRTGTPDMRAADYERVHNFAWHVYWSAPTSDVAAVEARCHRALAAHRFVNTTGTETYHVTPEFARAVVERLVIPPSPSTAIPLRIVSRQLLAPLGEARRARSGNSGNSASR
jgi:hypothetical protein